jgi:hypothetical protein
VCKEAVAAAGLPWRLIPQNTAKAAVGVKPARRKKDEPRPSRDAAKKAVKAAVEARFGLAGLSYHEADAVACDDEIINLLADRLGKLTVVGLQGNEAGPLERYVRRSALLKLAEDVLAELGCPPWAVDQAALIAIVAELRRARKAHARFETYHHALGVVREEYLEFEGEVFKRDVDPAAVAREAVQLAAMAVRTLSDLGLSLPEVMR